MKTLAVIPARLGATRLPRKPLRLLAGVPMVIRVMERVAALRVAERIVVATDSEEIADVVDEAGGEAVLTSDRHPSGTDRINEVVRKGGFGDYDVVLNVQGDEPFVTGAAIRGALFQVTEGLFPLGTVAAVADPRVLQQPDAVKVIRADDGAAMYFSRAAVPHLRDTADRALRDEIVLHHIGVYTYTPEALSRWVALPPHRLELVERLEQLRPLAAGMRIGVAVIDEAPRGGIDTELDLERANADWMSFTATDR
ncbi:MAG: 3-deoxy-manno-octulosonate cytidylyltransferase [Gemmatimonadaceae bacterium]|nr:3-deoxy-manno-octulosonate cytidylyltransferase [Geodermatophilaceae bacterium]MBA3670724.1 3-deoxy-manno-octulosonate cytidylyltransferase [Gemmatimonadaceae bacterium]